MSQNFTTVLHVDEDGRASAVFESTVLINKGDILSFITDAMVLVPKDRYELLLKYYDWGTSGDVVPEPKVSLIKRIMGWLL